MEQHLFFNKKFPPFGKIGVAYLCNINIYIKKIKNVIYSLGLNFKLLVLVRRLNFI